MKYQTDNAIEDYNTALRLDPKFAKAFANRGYSFCQIGRFDDAIRDATQAVKLDPTDPRAWQVGRTSGSGNTTCAGAR